MRRMARRRSQDLAGSPRWRRPGATEARPWAPDPPPRSSRPFSMNERSCCSLDSKAEHIDAGILVVPPPRGEHPRSSSISLASECAAWPGSVYRSIGTASLASMVRAAILQPRIVVDSDHEHPLAKAYRLSRAMHRGPLGANGYDHNVGPPVGPGSGRVIRTPILQVNGRPFELLSTSTHCFTLERFGLTGPNGLWANRLRCAQPMRSRVLRCRRTDAQDRSNGRPDDTVQNAVGRLCGCAVSRAKNGDGVRAADIVPTH